MGTVASFSFFAAFRALYRFESPFVASSHAHSASGSPRSRALVMAASSDADRSSDDDHSDDDSRNQKHNPN